jgi:glyoxylate/hydroxypyruvate reductase A
MLNRRLLDGLPRGAGFVNVGRGGHLVAEDLLAALDDRQLSAAVLDVVDPEPLPTGNALWHHPRILLTPLITGMTQPRIAAEAVIANLQRHRRGEPRVGLVDRARSY